MATTLTNTTFSTTYKDDYKDSDHFHRILFNSGKALQARELTQMQTIIQNEIRRMGSNIFKEGGKVNNGNLTINRREFVKLQAGQLPSTPSDVVGETFTDTNGIKIKVLKLVQATGADPDTLYVEYLDTTGGTSSAAPIRTVAGQTLTHAGGSISAMTTAATDAVGQGLEASITAGDFFVAGHFVFTENQSHFVSKYTTNPTLEIGFKIIQDVVTESDNNALYDNQGAAPNLAAPGAHRYRIRLELTTRGELGASDNFVFLADMINGSIADEVTRDNSYNQLQETMALRTREESGNYIVKPFNARFNNLNDSNLELEVTDGVAYVDGYRLAIGAQKIVVPKAQDTITLNNETIISAYGNYVLASGTDNDGLPNTDTYAKVNLNDAASYGGNEIGTARVRYVEEDGANYRLYLFDIRMKNGQNFSSTASIGTSASDFMNLVLESSKAVLKSTSGNNLLFPLPRTRPTASGITSDAVTVQERYTFSTNVSGDTTSAVSVNSGYVFTNTSAWVFSGTDSSIDEDLSVALGGGNTSFTVSGGAASKSYEVVVQQQKATPTARNKTLQETTLTKTWATDAESDGNGVEWISLERADIYNVKSIKATDSDGADISTSFTVDNGQRDNYYGVGRLVKRAGATITGDVFTRYEYFQHGTTGDFFNVTSYPSGDVPYDKIPNHRLNDGTTVSLRDVMDFRPVAIHLSKTDSGIGSQISFDSNGAGGDPIIHKLPTNTGTFTADVSYYMPRSDRLVATTIADNGQRIPRGRVKVLTGVSALDPQLPELTTGSLPLYNLELNPFTLDESDTTTSFIPAKRFTMADIADLEQRIDNLQELTTLSLLELNTSSLTVVDSAGNERTKAGFLADNFKDYAFSDVDRDEYRAAIDPLEGTLSPRVYPRNTRLIYDSAASGTVAHGDVVLLSIDSSPTFVDQNLATETENINPFAVITNNGTLTLSPASDEWVDTEYAPDTIVSGGTVTRNAGRINSFQNLGAWRANWIGRPIGNRVTVRGGITTRREIIADRVIDVSVIPFMRSRKIFFRAQGLRPQTEHFPFFGGNRISDYAREEAFQRFGTSNTADAGNIYNNITAHPDGSTSLISDSSGEITGSYVIPNNSTLRFRTGPQTFKLLDITANVDSDAVSKAFAGFTATGTLETRQRTVRSTRIQDVFTVIRQQPQDFGDGGNDGGAAGDPLAQSFYIDPIANPNGIFMTKARVYFATKDSVVPVQCQIRPVENGVPLSAEIQGAVKFLSPSNVNIPTDLSDMDNIRSNGTDFVFDEPVYLMPGREYCIVIKAESTEYNVFVAKVYDFLVGSTQARVSKQPTLGSLFLSQNSFTWTPDQNRDLMFQIYRADFATSGTAVLENATARTEALGNNPIQTTNASTEVRILHEGHGFTKNDKVFISGLVDSGDFGGNFGASITGSRTIQKVDHTGYTITADSSATATLRVGGSNVIVTTNAMYDTFLPSVQTMLPENTTLAAKVKQTSGSSFGDNRNESTNSTGTKDTSFTNITLNDFNFNNSPKVILNDSNEGVHSISGQSFEMNLDLSTTDTKVSPVIDLQRASITTFENVIDKQDSAATDGFNVPISFVNETDHEDGSSAAKHVTTKVTLDEPAVGLKIIFAANRPSAAGFEVYYKAGTSDDNLDDLAYVEVTEETNNPADEDGITFRQYEYLAGGQVGNLNAFTQFQVKVVMTSTNTSKVPTIQDLRTIALVT